MEYLLKNMKTEVIILNLSKMSVIVVEFNDSRVKKF